VAATGVGRSIQRIPGGGVSFVSRPQAKAGDTVTLTVTELDPGTLKTRALVTMPPGATDADTAWAPDGLLLVSVKGQIFCKTDNWVYSGESFEVYTVLQTKDSREKGNDLACH